MKKFITLLLVLTGIVCTASATNHVFAKLSSGASWWTNASAKTYIGSVEATTVTVWGETYYYWSFDSNQTGLQILRKSSDGSTQWNQTVTFDLTDEDKYIEILNEKDGDNQKINVFAPTAYLNDGDNSWGDSSTSQPFTPSTSRPNHQTYTFGATKLGEIRDGDYVFRFYANEHIQPSTNLDVISSSDYSTCEVGNTKAFKIAKAPNAKSVTIDVELKNSNNTWKWHVTATVTNYDNTTVCYVNDAENTNLGATVYAYAWDTANGLEVLENFPGTAMTPNADGTFSINVNYADDMKIIFNNKYDGGGDKQTANLNLAENAVYNFAGSVASQTVTVNAYKKATFSSEYPLDFSDVEGLVAYRITAAENGILSTEAVGKVPANTGLYIEGTTAKSYTVPTTVSAPASISTMMVAVTGDDEDVDATDGAGNTNFILTNKTTTNDSAPLKFYKVNVENGNTVPAGKAYLQIPTASVGARESFWFDEDATAIEAVKQNVKVNGEYFDLLGRKVAQPAKGLYIVNGKKVVIK